MSRTTVASSTPGFSCGVQFAAVALTVLLTLAGSTHATAASTINVPGDLREAGGNWRTGGQRDSNSPSDFFDAPVPALAPTHAQAFVTAP